MLTLKSTIAILRVSESYVKRRTSEIHDIGPMIFRPNILCVALSTIFVISGVTGGARPHFFEVGTDPHFIRTPRA